MAKYEREGKFNFIKMLKSQLSSDIKLSIIEYVYSIGTDKFNCSIDEWLSFLNDPSAEVRFRITQLIIDKKIKNQMLLNKIIKNSFEIQIREIPYDETISYLLAKLSQHPLDDVATELLIQAKNVPPKLLIEPFQKGSGAMKWNLLAIFKEKFKDSPEIDLLVIEAMHSTNWPVAIQAIITHGHLATTEIKNHFLEELFKSDTDFNNLTMINQKKVLEIILNSDHQSMKIKNFVKNEFLTKVSYLSQNISIYLNLIEKYKIDDIEVINRLFLFGGDALSGSQYLNVLAKLDLTEEKYFQLAKEIYKKYYDLHEGYGKHTSKAAKELMNQIATNQKVNKCLPLIRSFFYFR